MAQLNLILLISHHKSVLKCYWKIIIAILYCINMHQCTERAVSNNAMNESHSGLQVALVSIFFDVVDTGIHKTLNDLFQDYVIHHEQPDTEVPIDTEEDVEVLDYDKPESDTDSSGLSGDKPIYAGHWMSVKISVMLIWMFVIEHAVTGAQLSDLLTLLSLHCLSAHPGLVSIYKLKLFFTSLRSPLQKHYFCRNCHAPVTIDFVICPNRFCNADLSQSRARSFFLVIPLHSQITALFSRKGFAKCIGHRFARVKHNQNNIEDIYDSYVYKQLCDHDGPLSAKFPYNLSFTCNTDGIPLFKSSKFSIWPVYLMINELPYYLRKQQTNMLLYGLWFGESKPTMSTFCQPLHEMLSDLETVGVTVDVSGKPEICRCFLICLTADLPAKSLIMNTLQFNGNYSCSRCLQQGQNHRTTNAGNVHIFPYVHADPVGPPRTMTQCVEDAKLACTSQTAVHGIKGPSFLMFMNSFNFVRSTSVDYMHCILLGITKLLLTLWFSASHRDSKFSMYNMVHKVDERLQYIRPPSYISRLPRSISCHLKFWKASELRSWLLYYSLPILKDCMLSAYLYHYAALVETVYILSSSSISEQDIQLCQRNVRYFVYLFGELYGERYMTLNIHSLLHLPEVVCDIGPLWAHSCFPMESANGSLLKLFHGTQYVDVQILNAITLSNMMPRLVADVQVGNPAYKFVHKMSNILAYGQLSANKVLGKCYDKKLAETQYGLINSLFGCISNNVHVSFYKRLRRNCTVYNSLVELCVCIQIDDALYICMQPNKLESDI
jgi:hypothetical protein